MNWYAAEDKAKSVREVVVEVPQPRPVDSKFGTLMLGTKYHMLRANAWVTGFFRLESDPGPYLMLRADGHADRLKNQPFRVAFCFYRMKAGGLVAVFVDFPKLKIAGAPSAPYVLFEMIRGIDMEDERQRIGDAINRPQLHMCFAEGDGPGQDLPGGGWSGGSINASYDVLAYIDAECREALNREWKALLDYHKSISGGRRDFQASIQQMRSENPLTHNPVVDRSKASSAVGGAAAPSPAGTTDRKWWQIWK